MAITKSLPRTVSFENKSVTAAKAAKRTLLKRPLSVGSLQIASTPSSEPSMRRTVSFEDKVNVIEVQRVEPSMKNELFYCRSDYRRFRQEKKSLERMLDLSSFSLSSRSSSKNNKYAAFRR